MPTTKATKTDSEIKSYVNDKIFLLRKELLSAIEELREETVKSHSPVWKEVVREVIATARGNAISKELFKEINSRRIPENHGQLWYYEDDDILATDFARWTKTEAKKFKRSLSSIMFRVVKLLQEVGIEEREE